MGQITYTDKIATTSNPLPDINKVTDANMNEIKSVVNNNALHAWDMSSNLFPSNATFGYEGYGTGGPTTSLFDRNGSVIPNGTICRCIKTSGIASTTSALDWALTYTII